MKGKSVEVVLIILIAIMLSGYFLLEAMSLTIRPFLQRLTIQSVYRTRQMGRSRHKQSRRRKRMEAHKIYYHGQRRRG